MAATRAELKLAVPVWAERIEAEIRGSFLMVFGSRHLHFPHDAGIVVAGEMARFDIMQRFRWTATDGSSRHGPPDGPGVYRFANADTDEKLISFVKEFGPVWGKIEFEKFNEDGTSEVCVAQDLDDLRFEQQKFAALTKVVEQINLNARADRDAIIKHLAKIPWQSPYVLALSREVHYPEPANAADATIFWASFALCFELNAYPPKLIPYKGQVFELPAVHPEGIREAIYWQLRRDYLAQRAIGTCLNCGGNFPVFKKGATACGESCRRALRNQRYWSAHRQEINSKRKKKGHGE